MKASTNKIFKSSRSKPAAAAAAGPAKSQEEALADQTRLKENVHSCTSMSRKFNLKKVPFSDDEEDDEIIEKAASAQRTLKDKLNIGQDAARPSSAKAPAKASKRKIPSVEASQAKPAELAYDFDQSSGAERTAAVFGKKSPPRARVNHLESLLIDGDETIVADSGRFTSLVAMSKNFYSKKTKSDAAAEAPSKPVDIGETTYRKAESIKSSSSSVSASSSSSSPSSHFYSACSSASTSPADSNTKLSEDFAERVSVQPQVQVKKFTLKTWSSSPPATGSAAAPAQVAPARMPRLPKLSRAASANAATLQTSHAKPFYDFDATMSVDQHKTQPSKLEHDGTMIMLCNSRKAYECEELGESQAFADDLCYLMDGLGSEFSTGQRCLSAIKFAEHCLSSDFRMHLRSYHGTLAKVFGLLSDCTKEPSLALSASCIMYALSRDKLAMEIDKSMLKLMVEVAKMAPVSPLTTEFSTPISASVSTESLSSESAKRTKPAIFASRMAAASSKAMARSESGESPEELYAKTFKQCKAFCEKLLATQAAATAQTSPKSASKPAIRDKSPAEPLFSVSQFDLNLSELSAQQLAIECLLHLTASKKAASWLKDELLGLGALGLVVDSLRKIMGRLTARHASSEPRPKKSKKPSASKNTLPATPDPKGAQEADDEFYLICKYSRCVNLLENLTQTTQFGCSRSKMQQQSEAESNDGLGASSDTQGCDLTFFKPQSVAYRVHSHLIGQQMGQVCQDSLEFYFAELVLHTDPVKAPKSPSTPKANLEAQKSAFKRQIISQAIKKIFLFYLNLTQADITCTKELIGEEKMADLVFVFIRDIAQHVHETEQFDITVLGLIVLINLLVVDYNMKRTPGLSDTKEGSYMLKDIEWDLTKTKASSFEIIWNLYLSKQANLDLAENDHSNEIMELSERLSTQSAENINLAITESIHKAGKHMEEHIVAAHSAIIIAYLLKNSMDNGQAQLPSKAMDPARLKSELSSSSFQSLVDVIEKYLSFMDIMKVSGLSAGEHLKDLLTFLKKL